MGVLKFSSQEIFAESDRGMTFTQTIINYYSTSFSNFRFFILITNLITTCLTNVPFHYLLVLKGCCRSSKNNFYFLFKVSLSMSVNVCVCLSVSLCVCICLSFYYFYLPVTIKKHEISTVNIFTPNT